MGMEGEEAQPLLGIHAHTHTLTCIQKEGQGKGQGQGPGARCQPCLLCSKGPQEQPLELAHGTSRMAADMPSDTELLTNAKLLLTAA